MAQEARHRQAQAVWEAREGVSLPWNLFQTPLRAARDPEVEAVLGVYRVAHSLGSVSYTHLTLPTKRIV